MLDDKRRVLLLVLKRFGQLDAAAVYLLFHSTIHKRIHVSIYVHILKFVSMNINVIR